MMKYFFLIICCIAVFSNNISAQNSENIKTTLTEIDELYYLNKKINALEKLTLIIDSSEYKIAIEDRISAYKWITLLAFELDFLTQSELAIRKLILIENDFSAEKIPHYTKELKLFIDKISFLLKNLGININTVPVLDLRYKNTSNVIGDRSFSKNTKIVSDIGDLCIKYFKNNSIGTVIKHIPGHGLAKVDSHYFTPSINKSLDYLKKNDFKAFKSKNSLFAMTAHVIFKKIDPKNTVTHSKKLIDIIRNKIKFKNLIISDDLSMKSLKNSISENTRKSFSAGCNLALHNSPKVNSFVLKKTSEFYKNLS